MYRHLLPCLVFCRCSHPNSNMDVISNLISLIFVQGFLWWWLRLVFFKRLIYILFSGHLPIFIRSPFWWDRLRRSLLLLCPRWEACRLTGLLVLQEFLTIIYLWIPLRLFHLLSCIVSLQWWGESLRYMEKFTLALIVFLFEEIILIAAHCIGKVHVIRWNLSGASRMFAIAIILLESIFNVYHHLLKASRDIAFTSVGLFRHLTCVISGFTV